MVIKIYSFINIIINIIINITINSITNIIINIKINYICKFKDFKIGINYIYHSLNSR